MSGMQMIGSIVEFDTTYDDWNVYYERLEQFLDVNEVPEEKKSAFLISVIGANAYKSLRDLCHPVVPKDKSFEELCELLRKQFSPQISVFRERAKFYNARHEFHENVTQWYGRLKRLSVDCKFCGNLEAILTDKFVTGLRPGQVLDRLCEENESLKLDQALDIAINKECAAKDNAFAAGYNPPMVTCGMPRSALFGAPKACFSAPMREPLGCAKQLARPQACFEEMTCKTVQGGEVLDAIQPLAMEANKPADEVQMDVQHDECAIGQKAPKKRLRVRRRGKGRAGSIADDAEKRSVDEMQ